MSENSQEVFEDEIYKFNSLNWKNRVFYNSDFRRGHINIIDARENKGLWMMHCCIFPNVDNNSPVFGYDVIAGQNKISGFFLDFSPVVENHLMNLYFKNVTKNLQWKKTRNLPDWGKRIFSEDIIAAGNIKNTDTTDMKNLDIVPETLSFYLKNMNKFKTKQDFTEKQNLYAFCQKQNSHTPKTMKALQLNEEDVDIFVSKCLFPEINS